MKRKYALLFAVLATLALGALALNDQSLWIDELGTWRISLAESWKQWFAQFVSWPSSDAQIPLYHLYMRVWVLLFPSTELWLRAANLPWLFLGFLALLTTPTPKEARGFVWIFTAIVFLHPMVWYYANEARPYAMIIAGASISTSGMLARLLNPGNEAVLPTTSARLIVGTTVLIATSIIGMIWCISFLIPVVLPAVGHLRRRTMLSPTNQIIALICAVVLLPVAYQYASTVVGGVGATPLHESTWQSFVSGLYEVFGFGGIGPGREQLRSDGARALTGFIVPLLAYGITIGAVCIVGGRALFLRDRAAFLLIILAAIIPLVVFFALGSIKHWRVLGRHLVPLLFFFAIFLTCGLRELLRRRPSLAASLALGALALAAVVALTASSVEISHSARHRREDVRAAANLALDFLRSGNRTWWVALSFGGEYYKLPLLEPERCDVADTQAAVKFEDPQPTDLKNCLEPKIIVIERPDTFDREGAVRRYIGEHDFRRIGVLQGFEFFGKDIDPNLHPIRPEAAAQAGNTATL